MKAKSIGFGFVMMGAASFAGTSWADIIDSISISFSVSAPLEPNATYDISVEPSSEAIGEWVARDTSFGLNIIGTHAPILKVSTPNVALFECGQPCFGGYIQTISSGDIVKWDLVASQSAPFLTFITYNNS
jgi:hypothetical protein